MLLFFFVMYSLCAVLLLIAGMIQGGQFMECLLFAVLWPVTLAYLVITSNK